MKVAMTGFEPTSHTTVSRDGLALKKVNNGWKEINTTCLNSSQKVNKDQNDALGGTYVCENIRYDVLKQSTTHVYEI